MGRHGSGSAAPDEAHDQQRAPTCSSQRYGQGEIICVVVLWLNQPILVHASQEVDGSLMYCFGFADGHATARLCAFQVLLNTALYEGMKVTKTKNSIKFVANIAGDGPTSIMLKVTANDIQDLHTNVLELLPSA